jgi:hypothetical protein
MAELLKEEDEKQVEELVIVDKPIAIEHDDEDAHDVDPENPDAGETDAEREAIRERRRLEKLERKERRDKAITRDKTELDFLRKRNDELERRMSAQEQRAHQSDLGNLAQQATHAKQQAEMAERVIAKAVEAGNGEDVAKAMRYRDEAIQKFNQLSYAQQQVQLRPAVQAPAPDDRMMSKAREFLKENTWYDPQGRTEESAIVLAIDQALVKDGFDPTSDEYWDELKTRAARRLPERFSKNAPRESRGGPALGSGKEHAPVSTRKEVYISPARKQALVDAGVWDDPILRMKYVKRYAEYDRANRA